MVKVNLLGVDGVLHGSGFLNFDIIADRVLVERNKHIYKFTKSAEPNVAVFTEVVPPYCITEF